MQKYFEPAGWFELGHDICSWEKSEDNLWRPIVGGGCWIWDPPPAAAYKVAEQIRIARHQRQISYHIFVCPRLLTLMWRAQLHKSAPNFGERRSTNLWFLHCTCLCFTTNLGFKEEQNCKILVGFWRDKNYWKTKIHRLCLSSF